MLISYPCGDSPDAICCRRDEELLLVGPVAVRQAIALRVLPLSLIRLIVVNSVPVTVELEIIHTDAPATTTRRHTILICAGPFKKSPVGKKSALRAHEFKRHLSRVMYRDAQLIREAIFLT
jgi:hypothetical protein